MENDNSFKIVDPGVTNHVCFSFQKIDYWKQLETGEMIMKVRTEKVVSAIVVGSVKLFLKNYYLLLDKN